MREAASRLFKTEIYMRPPQISPGVLELKMIMRKIQLKYLTSIFAVLVIEGCAPTEKPSAPAVNLEYGVKTLNFSWAPVEGADEYRLLEDPDGDSGYAPVSKELTGTRTPHEIALHRRVNARYRIEACNAAGCSHSEDIAVDARELTAAIGYLKGSNTESEDSFGFDVAISADGNTLAVGAECESSAATGIDGDEQDNSRECSGAVYVFTRTKGRWSQQAYVKPSDIGEVYFFGGSLALSADGNLLVVGSRGEGGGAAGINGESEQSIPHSGAVYVFARTGAAWRQQAYIKAPSPEVYAMFGGSVALSDDGRTLAVSSYDGVRAAPGASDGDVRGVYVYGRSGAQWSEQAYITGADAGEEHFGPPVALSADGDTLVARRSDGVAVFTRAGAEWSRQAFLGAPYREEHDGFGLSLALSAAGDTLAVGDSAEDSAATGIDGEAKQSATNSGAVYVYTRTGSTWARQAYVKASNAASGDSFGDDVALSADGNILAVGAHEEGSGATGLDGDQADNSEKESGAVYLFARSGDSWSQKTYIKAPNTDASDWFGQGLDLSADGNVLAVGAPIEDGAANGVGGDLADNSAEDSGAVYLY